jgi:hypothetical protein
MAPPLAPDRRANNNAATNIKLDALHEDITDIKLVLKELTVAINRLAIVEERQSQAADALERAFTALEKVEIRVTNLEMVSVNSKQTNDWVGKVIWAGLAVLVIFILRKVGLWQ